ncbi:hypothetical protein HY11_17505 [Hyphomonas pacifica]|nr:hypothetical protein HY11_17505 [Hyphomonas pacifica]
MFKNPNTGGSHSFFYGRPGAPHWDRRFGIEVHYNNVALTIAALTYRQNGPAYLKSLPLSEINSLLQNFVSEHYWYLSGETFAQRFDSSFADQVCEQTKVSIASALESSALFHPDNHLHLYPLIPVEIAEPFDHEHFFVCAPTDLTEIRLGTSKLLPDFAPNQFPPFADSKLRVDTGLASWLGIWSPDQRAAGKMKAAILGAFALTPYHRHMFSGRHMFGGVCVVDHGYSVSWGQPHTPAMMDNIKLTQADHAWLRSLGDLLTHADNESRQYVRALEYFYRAWPKSEVERFPLMFMTLDAVFGDRNNSTQAVIDGIRSVLGDHIDEKRVRSLMEMRASVIHGGSPDIYDSRKYPKYYRSYETDPIRDLENLVAACLMKKVFKGGLKQHEDPHLDIRQQMITQGRIFGQSDALGILEGEP